MKVENGIYIKLAFVFAILALIPIIYSSFVLYDVIPPGYHFADKSGLPIETQLNILEIKYTCTQVTFALFAISAVLLMQEIGVLQRKLKSVLIQKNQG